MINYIKDAVTAVSGIKSFLFNTDYRNNFDLQNVEFPCCVLTPIMRTNYDLNNIIRESAELQLSVVDLAPYEYTGDDLYAINKRCSDLALQVIANLQVKSKLDKELTFEFILPSGDELISGVMCNLQCTMKQGSCIGAPSYIEVIVQPLKKESITSNGKHIISADKGFNAMKEVEVDVQISELTTEEKIVDITSNGEVEILPTNADAMTKVTANVQVPPPPLEEKQVTITKAKTTEIITPDAEYGLSKVEVSTDVKPNLQDKSITISENGTQTITADSEFEGLSSVEVTTDVNTLQGLDFSDIYDAEQANGINQYYKDGIEYAEEIKRNWDDNITSVFSKFNGNQDLIFLPNLNYDKVTDARSFCNGCRNLEYAKVVMPNVDKAELIFSGTYNLKHVYADLPKATVINEFTFLNSSLRYAYLNCPMATLLNHIFYVNYGLITAKLPNVSRATSFNEAFLNCNQLTNLEIGYWAKSNISLGSCSKLTPMSVHNIIQNAMNVADGATARTLTLNASAKTNWQNSEYYEQDLAVLSTKGITIA
jgi:hypothetical protein